MRQRASFGKEKPLVSPQLATTKRGRYGAGLPGAKVAVTRPVAGRIATYLRPASSGRLQVFNRTLSLRKPS
jgi:hypothetical protein